ncbi:MAG: CPBP family intramembrane metalloprotease [Chloroflexi bacterium]|nr:CPBP family intramembrane metalloprotease [Chloroflexota bacterium]
MNCRSCGFSNTPGSRFCSSCGTLLPRTCDSCESPLVAGARFCANCGTPVVSDTQGRPSAAIRADVPFAHPFLYIKARSLVLWTVLSVPVLIILYVLAAASATAGEEIDPFFESLIFSSWLYGLLALWCIWKSAQKRVDFGLLIGRIPAGYHWLPVLGVVALLMVFSISTFWLFLYWLAVNFPDAADFFAEGEFFVTSESSRYSGLYNTQVFIMAVFVAPVIEEFVFRGILLTRWSLKWGTTSGIFVSSLVFALLHADLLGSFAFGVAMSLLYLQTRTLLVPMMAHALNNLVVAELSVLVLAIETGESASLAADLESGLMLAVVGALLMLPLVLWYFVRNWPRGGETVPYLAREPSTSQE